MMPNLKKFRFKSRLKNLTKHFYEKFIYKLLYLELDEASVYINELCNTYNAKELKKIYPYINYYKLSNYNINIFLKKDNN